MHFEKCDVKKCDVTAGFLRFSRVSKGTFWNFSQRFWLAATDTRSKKPRTQSSLPHVALTINVALKRKILITLGLVKGLISKDDKKRPLRGGAALKEHGLKQALPTRRDNAANGRRLRPSPR